MWHENLEIKAIGPNSATDSTRRIRGFATVTVVDGFRPRTLLTPLKAQASYFSMKPTSHNGLNSHPESEVVPPWWVDDVGRNESLVLAKPVSDSYFSCRRCDPSRHVRCRVLEERFDDGCWSLTEAQWIGLDRLIVVVLSDIGQHWPYAHNISVRTVR